MANFPYEPTVYRPNSTIAQLMLEQGNQQADSARNLWGGVGQTIAGVGQAAGQVIQQKQEQQRISKQDQAFLSRLSDPNAPPLTPQDAVRIYGPERGMAIFKGYQSLQSPEPDLKTVIAGFDAASPEMRAQAWPAARDHLVKAGVPGVPEQYDDGYFQRFKQAVSGEKPAAPYSLNPGEKRFGADNKLIAENPALEKPEKLDTRSLEARLAAAVPGSPEAKQILSTMRAQAEATRAPREPKEDKLYPVDTVDAEGNPIKSFVTEADARAMATGGKAGLAKPASTATQNRVTAAKSSIESGEAILAELQDPKIAAEIGPVIGRYNSLAAAAGAGDPTAQYMVGAIKSFAALQPQIHGFRAVQMAKDVESLLGTKQTPEALAAGLKGILQASYIVAGKKQGDSNGQTRKGPDGKTYRKVDGGWEAIE